MKISKHLIRIGSALFLVLIVFAATAHQAQAQGGVMGFLGLDLGIGETLNMILAFFVNSGLKIMGWLLAISGAVLNFSINLTLNIKSFVDNAPAIYTTWRAIRDISGIFFIFFLLYSAIQLILGLKGPKYADTLKNIVIAGALINFSFFFAGLGIDVSNVVSMQLYNAIVPENPLARNAATIGAPVTFDSIVGAGGISNIFMNSLEIPKLYNVSKQQGSSLGSTNSNPGVLNDTFKIVMIGIVGIIIMFTAAMSFFAAALAFIGRFVLLIFLLAFSPIYFLSFLSPEVKEYAGKWWNHYRSMLLFMPVYLLLMYLALNVLTTTPMFNKSLNSAPITATAPAPSASGSLIESALAQTRPPANSDIWYKEYLLLAVNATIVIFLLNLPLVAAASIAGKAPVIGDMLAKASTKFGAKNIWKTVGASAGTAGALGYRGTLGRAASKISQAEGFKNFASNWKVGELALKGTRAAGATYDKKLGEQVSARTQFAESLGADQRAVNTANVNLRTAQQVLAGSQQALATAQAAGAPPAAIAAHQATIALHRTAVGIAKANLSTVQNRRQDVYADRTNTGTYDTLYLYVARKNKLAAAKVQLPIIEKRLIQEKDDLKTTRDDIKKLRSDIRNNPGGIANPAQAAELVRLQNKEVTDLATVNATEAQIDNLKLIT